MKTAIVVGGGVGGLASAKTLSRYFDRVTLYDGGPQPQAMHLHVLLAKGQKLLEEMFPGMMKKIKQAGCAEIDWAQDTIWENKTGSFPRYNSTIKTLSMSRMLLQDLMKADVLNLPNVKIINERLDAVESVRADLVVMAAGQNISMRNVIDTEDTNVINLTYRSFVFRQADVDLGDCKQYYYQVDPPVTNLGYVLCPIEDGKLIVTLIEYEERLSICQSYQEFLSKGGDKFKTMIGDAKPISVMSVFRKMTTHRRKLDQSRIPKNMIFIGDSVTSLNPVFGQGMTLSLMQVRLLDDMLQGEFNPARFQRVSYRLGTFPYALAQLNRLLLRTYMRVCQRIQPLHHHFLQKLHSP